MPAPWEVGICRQPVVDILKVASEGTGPEVYIILQAMEEWGLGHRRVIVKSGIWGHIGIESEHP